MYKGLVSLLSVVCCLLLLLAHVVYSTQFAHHSRFHHLHKYRDIKTLKVQGQQGHQCKHSLLDHQHSFFLPLKSEETINPDERVLMSVSAVAADDVWASGYYSGGTDVYPVGGAILKHWNGHIWQDVSLPAEASRVMLSDVKAFGPKDVYVIAGTLPMHWDGSTWQHIATDFAVETPEVLAGTATHNLWLAGNGFLLSWNGARWRSIPDPSINVNTLEVLDKDNVWLAGVDPSQNEKLVIQHWDGKLLSRVPDPVLAAPQDTSLTGIAAVDKQDIWITGNARERTLILHWNGKSWKELAHPDPGLFYNHLSGITALSKNNIWVAGSTQMNTCLFYCARQTLIEHWNGAQWQLVPSSNVVLAKNVVRDNILNKVTALSGTDIWAVGTSYNGYALSEHYSAYQGTPLIEHWNGKTWQIVSSDS